MSKTLLHVLVCKNSITCTGMSTLLHVLVCQKLYYMYWYVKNSITEDITIIISLNVTCSGHDIGE
jgi:hypothetical protein